MKKTAILGGTFDPIHTGHLKLAENAWNQFSLDECWFLPAPNPPHKAGHVNADYADRLAMARLAVEPYPHFTVSDFESRRPAGLPSYTSETLKALCALYPDTEFSFLIGADSFYEIEGWHEPGEIFQRARILVADRDYEKNHDSLSGHAETLRRKFGARIDFIRAEEVDISSAHIRAMFASGSRTPKRLIPPAVFEYIQAHHLYAQ